MPLPYTGAWPTNFDGCTFTGTFVGLDGQVIQGKLTFAPRPTVLLDYDTPVTIVPRAVEVTLDVNGHFSIVVPATDDPDISPSYWTYKVTQSWPGGLSFDVEAPMGTVVDLTRVTPVPDGLGNPIVRGPAGVPGGAQTVQGVPFDEGGNIDLTGVALLVGFNLSDLEDVAVARGHLGLTALATTDPATMLTKAGNLAGLADEAASRGNLGLGTASTHADGEYLHSADNLSDVADPVLAAGNLGLSADMSIGVRYDHTDTVDTITLNDTADHEAPIQPTVVIPRDGNHVLKAQANFQIDSTATGPGRYGLKLLVCPPTGDLLVDGTVVGIQPRLVLEEDAPGSVTLQGDGVVFLAAGSYKIGFAVRRLSGGSAADVAGSFGLRLTHGSNATF